MMKSLTIVSGKRQAKPAKGAMSKGKPPKGKLKRMHVEPMDNGGFTVESHHEMPPRKPIKKGSMMAEPYDFDAGTHRAGFADAGSALKHMGSLMSGSPNAEPDGDEPPNAGPGDNDGDEG